MQFSLDLDRHHTVSNSGDLTLIPRIRADGIAADIGIEISGDNPFEFRLFGRALDLVEGLQDGISMRTVEDVFGIVEDCRRCWAAEIVDLKVQKQDLSERPNYEFPFQKNWSFDDTWEKTIHDAVARLARAGDDLFTLIFERDCDEDLTRLSATLRETLHQAESLNICITSTTLFMPWGMVYTHPTPDEALASDGSNWKKEGFWGYQHTVWQNTKKQGLKSEITLSDVVLSLNFDETLPSTLKLPGLTEHFDKISALAGNRSIRRTKKAELETAFRNRRATIESIVYFYCHGRGATTSGNVNLRDTQLRMTDQPISTYDLQLWSGNEKLPTHPLVFINACQGGQMTTMFYKTLAAELLRQEAVGLIGAQIDIPAVFAAEYGHRILSTFLARSNRSVRLGTVIRDVNRFVFNEHRNPLGLAYSLYRGANCFIDW